MIRISCRYRIPNSTICRSFASLSTTTNTSIPRATTTVQPAPQNYHQQLDGEDYLKTLASSSPDTISQLLGPPRVRSTVVEAAVRMIADYFLMYDAMDKVLLNQEMKLSFGSTGEETQVTDQGIVKVNQPLLEKIDKKLLDEVREKFYSKHLFKQEPDFDKYMELAQSSMGASTPQYNSARSKAAYSELQEYLSQIQPEKLAGLSEILMKANDVPDLDVFHMIIRQLNSLQYRRPAQTVIDCLLLSDMELTPETLHLALNLAINNGNIVRFVQLTRIFSEFCRVDTKFDPKMSNLELGEWYKPNKIDNQLRSKFFSADVDGASVESPRESKHLTLVYRALANGFFKFGWYNQMDRLLSWILTSKVPSPQLDTALLTYNFKIASKTKDRTRFYWTWNRVQTIDSSSKEGGQSLAAALSCAQNVDPSFVSKIRRHM